MTKTAKIQVLLTKPKYPIEQAIYIPEKSRVIETKIYGYDVQVMEGESGLVGFVSNYRIQEMVSVRRGEELDFVNLVKESDFYTNRKKAEGASKFLEVKVDDEMWKLAIGDREVTDEDSPYHTDKSGLPSCCGNISEARDILLLCRTQSGLIGHNRDELSYIIRGHGLHYRMKSPIGIIFQQLGIKKS